MATGLLFLLLVLPLLLSGIIHHFLVIRYNLFPYLTQPVDKGLMFSGKPLFGKSKTWRGFITVSVLNSVFTYLISIIFNINLYRINFLYLGFILGLSYSFSELPTSFIKRRLSIKPSGQTAGIAGFFLYLLDQSDSVSGSLITANFIIHNILPVQNLMIFLLGVGLHISLDTILYVRGYKNQIDKPGIVKTLLSRVRQK